MRAHLANNGVSAGEVQDWYEPHYISVCKGMWQSAGTHIKNETSTHCTAVPMGYTFSLPKLLAADAGLPANSALLSSWSFAVLHTSLPAVCLVVSMTFVNWALVDYGIAILKTWGLTAETPRFWLWQGFLPSVPALVVLILSSADITARTQKILSAKAVAENGVAWSNGGFYAVTWVATGLMFLVVALWVLLFIKLRMKSRFMSRELGWKC